MNRIWRAVPCFTAVLTAGLFSAVLWGAPQSAAVRTAQQECDRGDAKSCENLGVYYEKGLRGLQRDDATAVQFFDKACAAGSKDGCGNLGRMYADGKGVQRDAAKAFQSYLKACDAGSADDCYTLGEMSARGEGVPKDDTKALQFYQKACDGGDAEGCAGLGAMYAGGKGAQKDAGKAAQLFQKACDGDDPKGCNRIGAAPKAHWGAGLPDGAIEHLRPLEEVLSKSLLLLDKEEYGEVYKTLASPAAVAEGEKNGQTAARIANIKDQRRNYIKAFATDLMSNPMKFEMNTPIKDSEEVLVWLQTGTIFYRIGNRWYFNAW